MFLLEFAFKIEEPLTAKLLFFLIIDLSNDQIFFSSTVPGHSKLPI